jgi:D-psicose/D-tagatose/L-ribulose 3-epimerase
VATQCVRLGVNLMAWSGRVGPEELGLLEGIAALGYDGVELPIFEPESLDAERVRAALAAAGLGCTASGALPVGASLLEPDERARGVDYVDACLAAAARCGASLLCGPYYAPVGNLPGRPRSAAEWDSAVAGLRAVAERAADRGMVLALEVLNRFETHFLNTAEDALRLVAEVDRPGLGVLLDTFHMNVEEKDPVGAIELAGASLAHVHFSENDRGVVGTGHVAWTAVAEALGRVGYLDSDRWIVCETFTGEVAEIAAATAVWRPLVPGPWEYAAESLKFIRSLLAGSAPARP